MTRSAQSSRSAARPSARMSARRPSARRRDANRDGRQGAPAGVDRVKSIEDSDQLYREIVEALTEGIWVLDANDVTPSVNPEFAALLG